MRSKKDNSALGWIWRVAGAGRKWVYLKTVLRMLQGLAGIGYAYTLRSVVDSAVDGQRDAFWQHLWLFVLLVGCTVLLLALTRYADERAKATLEKEYRIRFFSQLLHRDFFLVTRTHSGEWMNRLTSDATVVVNGVAGILPELCGTLVRMLGALLCLYLTVPKVTYILLPWGLVMIAFSQMLRNYLKKLHKNVQQADGTARSFLQEQLYSLLAVHAFTREEITEENAREHLDRLVHARVRKNRFVNFSSTAMNAALLGAQVIGIAMCCWGILENTMTYGTMSAVLYLVNMLEGPMANMSSFVPAYYAMIASAERLMEVESYPEDTRETPATQEEVRQLYDEAFSYLGLENACFAYEDDPSNAVLQGLNIRLEKGQFLAFTGESGCGKTTTLKVLLSLYPLDSGSRFVQCADGSRLELSARWRSLFAYVPQGNQLTYGTLRQTLTFSDPELMGREAQIWQALRVACAEGFVKDLPEGLDTQLGERGTGFSEGQMQRIAIARALLTQRPILLLDEATSALDPATEAQVMQQLRAMTDRTVLLVTHRESILPYCDATVHFSK